MSVKTKKSAGNICLMKGIATIDVPDNVPVIDGYITYLIEVELRAWECPFCGESQMYLMADGCVIKGIGGSTLYSNGKESDCCGKHSCREKQEKFHSPKGKKRQ